MCERILYSLCSGAASLSIFNLNSCFNLKMDDYTAVARFVCKFYQLKCVSLQKFPQFKSSDD